MTKSGKHSSLLRYEKNCQCKKFYSTGLRENMILEKVKGERDFEVKVIRQLFDKKRMRGTEIIFLVSMTGRKLGLHT